MHERGRPPCHPSIYTFSLLHLLYFSCIYDSLACCRHSAHEQAAALLAISRCVSEGVKKEEGMVRQEQLKASVSVQAPVFHLYSFQRRGSRIRSFGPLAAWLPPAAQRQLSFTERASLCPLQKDNNWNQMLFQKPFVQSEHIRDRARGTFGLRSKRNSDKELGLELQHQM